MEVTQLLPQLNIWIGYDSREVTATEIAAYSIRKRTKSSLNIKYLKHRELRKAGLFTRPWLIESQSGDFRDLIDNRPFSTEFSHTRFLVPALQNYQGWALFMDGDMLFLSDIKKLFTLCDDKYAVMVVKHTHHVKDDSIKMDDRKQLSYVRKNWSSFILFNCGHPANKKLTKEYISTATGTDLHSFKWLNDSLIGELPDRYNYIAGVSRKLGLADEGKPGMPAVVHYTEGGPWFPNYRNVPFAQLWLDDYELWQEGRSEYQISEVPTTAYDKEI